MSAAAVSCLLVSHSFFLSLTLSISIYICVYIYVCMPTRPPAHCFPGGWSLWARLQAPSFIICLAEGLSESFFNTP